MGPHVRVHTTYTKLGKKIAVKGDIYTLLSNRDIFDSEEGTVNVPGQQVSHRTVPVKLAVVTLATLTYYKRALETTSSTY